MRFYRCALSIAITASALIAVSAIAENVSPSHNSPAPIHSTADRKWSDQEIIQPFLTQCGRRITHFWKEQSFSSSKLSCKFEMENSQLKDLQIVNSSGDAKIDEAALKSVKSADIRHYPKTERQAVFLVEFPGQIETGGFVSVQALWDPPLQNLDLANRSFHFSTGEGVVCPRPALAIMDKDYKDPDYMQTIAGPQRIELVSKDKFDHETCVTVDVRGCANLVLKGKAVGEDLRQSELTEAFGAPTCLLPTTTPEFVISTVKGPAILLQTFIAAGQVWRFRIVLDNTKSEWTVLKTKK